MGYTEGRCIFVSKVDYDGGTQLRARIGETVWNSKKEILVSGCGGMNRSSLGSSTGSLIGSRPGVKQGLETGLLLEWNSWGHM